MSSPKDEETPLVETTKAGVVTGEPTRKNLLGVFRGFWPLGWIAFGGPQAHIALVLRRFVEREFLGERWLDERQFLEIFSLCSALPGPTSTQVVTAVGTLKAGIPGGLLAFTLFQVPGFLALLFLGSLFRGRTGDEPEAANAFLAIFRRVALGLVAAAFSQVLLAAYAITKKTCGTDNVKLAIATVSTVVAAVTPPLWSSWAYPSILAVGGLAVVLLSPGSGSLGSADGSSAPNVAISKPVGFLCLSVYTVITALAVIAATMQSFPISVHIGETFWRIGSLVFGGGQVVLPMLYDEITGRGWLTEAVFLYGFALVQTMPGPLFNLSTFIGAAMLGLRGALLASVGIFLPGVLLVFGTLPFWDTLRKYPKLSDFLAGVSAGAAGLINSAIYVFWVSSITNRASYAIAAFAGALTVVWSVPVPHVIVLGGILGFIMTTLGIGV